MEEMNRRSLVAIACGCFAIGAAFWSHRLHNLQIAELEARTAFAEKALVAINGLLERDGHLFEEIDAKLVAHSNRLEDTIRAAHLDIERVRKESRDELNRIYAAENARRKAEWDIIVDRLHLK